MHLQAKMDTQMAVQIAGRLLTLLVVAATTPLVGYADISSRLNDVEMDRVRRVEFQSVALTSEAVKGKSPVRLESDQSLPKNEETIFGITFSEWPADCEAKYAVFRVRRMDKNREITVQSGTGRIVAEGGGRSIEARIRPVTMDGPFKVYLQIGESVVGQGVLKSK
jgi:hypothetical protein